MNLEGMSLKKKFWRFVWPSVVAQWIFALYTMVDGMFVARGVSEVALSAVNIASPFVNFLFSVSILFAVGTSTVVAIFLGQGRQREANQANTQNMVVTGVLSLFIMLMVWLCLDPIVSFLGATQSTQEYVNHYILSLLPFTWWFIISYTFETLVKTDGFPRFAAAAVASGALVNCAGLSVCHGVSLGHWGSRGSHGTFPDGSGIPVSETFPGAKGNHSLRQAGLGLGTVYPGGEDWPVLRFYGLHGIYVQPCHSAVYR